MTFQRRLTELVHHATMAVLPRPQLPPEDLPLALAGHHALVLLLRNLHPLATVVRAAASPVWSRVEEIESHPIPLLGRLLAEHPSMPPISPIDAQATEARSRLGAHWQQIGRHATVALADWHAADPATRPQGEASWTVVAHVAALSRALPVLDGDVSRALADHGHPEQSRALAAAATSGLATVAATVLDLASVGPLPELRPSPVPSRPIRVNCVPAVVAGQQRLARLLEHERELHPSDVDLISKLQWRTAIGATSVLDRTHAELASAMTAYSQALADVPGALTRVASLHGRNPAAVVQARQLHGYVTAARDTPEAVDAAVGFATQVPVVVSALHAAAARMVDAGKWLVIDETAGPGAPWWTPSRPGTPARVLDALATARHVARSWQLPPAPAESPSSSPGFADAPAGQALDALAAAVTQRIRRSRPASPVRPPHGLVERRPEALAEPSVSKAEIALLERVAARTPVTQIAEQLGASPSTVYARLIQIYAKLRDDGQPARGHGYKGRRFARTAAGALDVVAALADSAEARREVERLTEVARPGPGHDEQLRQARAGLHKAQQRLDRARRKIAVDSSVDAAPTRASPSGDRGRTGRIGGPAVPRAVPPSAPSP